MKLCNYETFMYEKIHESIVSIVSGNSWSQLKRLGLS